MTAITGFIGGGIFVALVGALILFIVPNGLNQRNSSQTIESSLAQSSTSTESTLPQLPIVASTKKVLSVTTFLSENEMKSLVAKHKNDPGFFTSGEFSEYVSDYLVKDDADNLIVVIPTCASTGGSEGPGSSVILCQNEVYLKVSNEIEAAFAKIYTFEAERGSMSYASIKANTNNWPEYLDVNTPYVQTFILNIGYMRCCDAARYLDSWLISYSSRDKTTTVYRLNPMDMELDYFKGN